jgi:hypothetical protein
MNKKKGAFFAVPAKNRAIRSNSSPRLRRVCGISASIPCAPTGYILSSCRPLAFPLYLDLFDNLAVIEQGNQNAEHFV